MTRHIERNLVFDTPYFNRMWTFQEGVAGFTVVIQVGRMVIELKRVIRALYYLKSSHSLHMSTVESLTTLYVLKKVWWVGMRLTL